MSVDRKVPEIRAKEFSKEWEQLSFLDSIEHIIDFRGRTPKKLGLDWSPSGYRALSALNVKQGYIDFLIDPHFGDQELYDKWMSGSELHQGQVLFTTEAPMGNVAQVPNTDKYILSQRTIAFIVKSEIIVEDFLAVLLRSSKVFRELSALSSGGTAKGVSQKVLANLSVSVPKDLAEQATIGNFFQKLDYLINQHQQKHDKLSNIKKAMLEKMFPKQGETMPEIRFKGFSGEWESKVLGSVSSFYKGKGLPKSSIQENSVYPCIHYGELFTKYSEVIEVVTSRTNQKDNFFSISNDVLMPTSDVTPKGLVKSCCVKQNGVVLGGDILIIRPNGQNVIDGAFLSRFIRTREQQVLQNVTGSTVFHLYASSIENLNIVFPSIKEQTAIGNYFQKLDNLINQHQQQITRLNNIKQACLSKMFV
uniref:restriction endonuclease subunit S n=1 Tax=Hafnia alvei TaxID=569 RepID=UPI00242D4028|nr:restriction endonuclease subunit S [Hafnia alvei]